MTYSARSHIETLPIETLAAIFLLAAPAPLRFEDWSGYESDEPKASPITLSGVSKTWRDIAVSTPLLWTSLSWEESTHNPMLLALHIERSKSLPLHLSLHLTYGENDTLVSPSVDCILLPSLSRINTLHLTHPSSAWRDQLSRLTSTTAMSITWCAWGGEVPLNKCHSLRRLRLHQEADYFNDQDEKIFYKIPHSLEELHLAGVPLDISVQLFLLSPHLVQFSATSTLPPYQNLNEETSRQWFGQPSVFEHLENFEWDHRDDDWANRLLSQISTPKLRHLCLTGLGPYYMPDPPTQGENQFFRRLPDTLSTLELECTEVFEPINSSLFNCPSVENLNLRGVASDYISDLFKELTPTPRHQRYLPKLRNLSIYGFGVDDLTLEPEDLQSMVSMLEHRLAKGDVFCLTYSGCTLDWTPEIQGNFRDLKAKGVQLEIVEGSGAVDWLK